MADEGTGTALLEPPPMAKKRTTSPPEPDAKPTVFSMKGTPEWRDWLQRGAKHCRTDAAKMVDAAIAEYLKKRGFAEEPPER